MNLVAQNAGVVDPRDALIASLLEYMKTQQTATPFTDLLAVSAMRPGTNGNVSLADAIEQFLIAKRAAGLTNRTICWYGDQIAVFVNWCKAMQISQVSPMEIEKFLAGQRDIRPKLADATISARYRALSALFGWISERYNLTDANNPMHGIKAPRIRKKPVEYVKLREFQQLYDSIRGNDWLDERDRLILLTLFWSGLRVGEVCALAVHDIDVKSQLICVRTAKGDSARFVPCAPDLAAVLVRYLYSRPAWRGAELILSSDGYEGAKGILMPEGVRQMLIRRCSDATMRPMNPHSFRHGFAMTFLNAGMQLSAISEAMGHSSTTITRDIYARWLTQGLSREYERVRKTLVQEQNRLEKSK